MALDRRETCSVGRMSLDRNRYETGAKGQVALDRCETCGVRRMSLDSDRYETGAEGLVALDRCETCGVRPVVGQVLVRDRCRGIGGVRQV